MSLHKLIATCIVMAFLFVPPLSSAEESAVFVAKKENLKRKLSSREQRIAGSGPADTLHKEKNC